MDACTLKTGITVENKKLSGPEIRAVATSTARRDSDRASFGSSSDFNDVTRNDFATTIFSGTQRCNVGTVLQLFAKQCCNVVLR